jgi:hypothetical protein
MIFAKKKKVWCDDPTEDRVISIFAGCLDNHDRTHSHMKFQVVYLKRDLFALIQHHTPPPPFRLLDYNAHVVVVLGRGKNCCLL